MPFFKKKTKMEFISLFFRQLSSMIASGIPVSEALDILEEEKDSKHSQTLSADVKNDLLSDHETPSDTNAYPAWFKTFIASTLKPGAVAQDLPNAMNQIADDYDAMEAMESRIASAMVYPLSLIVIAAVVTGVIIVFVIPTFTEMFESFGSSLPAQTRLVIFISGWLVKAVPWVVLGLLFVVLALKFNKPFRDHVLIYLPGIKNVIKTISIIRFLRTLSLMLSVQAPVQKALFAAADAVPNSVYADKFKLVFQNTDRSDMVCDGLEHTGMLPKLAIRILRAGERNSSLGQALNGLAQYYENRRLVTMEQTIRIIEVMITIGIATFIGFLVVSMYLPIFKMAGAVSG